MNGDDTAFVSAPSEARTYTICWQTEKLFIRSGDLRKAGDHPQTHTYTEWVVLVGGREGSRKVQDGHFFPPSVYFMPPWPTVRAPDTITRDTVIISHLAAKPNLATRPTERLATSHTLTTNQLLKYFQTKRHKNEFLSELVELITPDWELSISYISLAVNSQSNQSKVKMWKLDKLAGG